jgi:hypothetical protein
MCAVQELKKKNHDILLYCIYIAVYPTKLHSVATCNIAREHLLWPETEH